MDLIVLVLMLAVIGFFVYLITTNIPMDPMFRMAIKIIAIVAVVFYLLNRFGGGIPNLL